MQENRSCLRRDSTSREGHPVDTSVPWLHGPVRPHELVSCAGLAPVLAHAERAGFQQLVCEHVSIGMPGGGNAHLKVPALVAGMVAGADSIEDMALLRHGGAGRLFTGVRAPSTLGDVPVRVHLRARTSARRGGAPAADQTGEPGTAAARRCGLAYIDVDDTVRATYGHAKAGAARLGRRCAGHREGSWRDRSCGCCARTRRSTATT